MSGDLSNLGYGWGPLTSGTHITVFTWILPSSSILPAIGRGATMSFYVCLMGMLRHHSYSPSCWSSHSVSFGNMVMLQLSIDDSYLHGDTYAQCLENIHATRSLLVSLGFSINRDKSVQPTQRIIFLGFVLDSLNMSICLGDTHKRSYSGYL